MDSYDDGYNAIYEDDDYDGDRYWGDDEYADGVDDAMEDDVNVEILEGSNEKETSNR